MAPTPTQRDLIPWWRSFVFRFVGLFVGIIITLVALAVWQLNRTSAQDIQRTFGRQLRAMAATAAGPSAALLCAPPGMPVVLAELPADARIYPQK